MTQEQPLGVLVLLFVIGLLLDIKHMVAFCSTEEEPLGVAHLGAIFSCLLGCFVPGLGLGLLPSQNRIIYSLHKKNGDFCLTKVGLLSHILGLLCSQPRITFCCFLTQNFQPY